MQNQIKQVITLLELKRIEEAEKKIKDLLKINSNNDELRRILGVIFALQKKEDLALLELQKALKLNQYNFNTHSNIGNIYTNQEKYEKALSSYKKALSINPYYSEGWVNLGNLQIKQNNAIEAFKSYKNALKINHNEFSAYSGIGNCLIEFKQIEEALYYYSIALDINQKYVDGWVNKGWACYCLRNYPEANLCYETALTLDSKNIQAWNNKGVLLFELEKYDEAENCYLKAHLLDNRFHDGIKNIFHFYLWKKDFANGWKYYKKRWNINPPLQTIKPEWSGDQSAKRLFIWSEQGIGDQILYASMLFELQSFPQEKIVSVNKKLLPIFIRSFPNYRFIDKDEFLPEERYDEQLPLGDLGRFFRPDIASFEAVRFPYLVDDVTRTDAIRGRLPNNRNLKCGISWKSSNRNLGDHKSIPLNMLMPLLQKDGMDFINLQYGDIAQELQELRVKNIDFHQIDTVDVFEDIDGVLSIIQACDIIITVSNTTAHLAGALGKKTYLLLPKGRGKLWYWHQSTNKNLWYPSIHSIEQDTPGDWNNVVQKLMIEVEK